MRYCRRCDAKYFTDDEKCRSCGRELVDGEDVYPHEIGKGLRIENKALLVPAALLLVITVSLIFSGIPTGKITAAENCREVEEEYLTEVPYEVETLYAYYPKYNAVSSYLEEGWNNQLGAFYNYTVILQNLDVEDYYYSVEYLLDTSKHGGLASIVRKLVKKGSNESFEAYFDTDLDEDVDGKFAVYPEPVQKIGKAIRLENKSLLRKITKCS